MSSRIEVIISPDGSSRLQTKGIQGSSCRQGSRFLEQALGIVQCEQLTDEFYRSSTGNTVQLQQDQEDGRHRNTGDGKQQESTRMADEKAPQILTGGKTQRPGKPGRCILFRCLICILCHDRPPDPSKYCF